MTIKANAPSELEHAQWAYTRANAIAAEYLPYVFGGGHGEPAVRPNGILPTGGGYDCSGAASSVLWYAGVLGSQEALSTEQLENWGKPGVGEFLTLYVIDSPVIHHCALRFSLPEHPQHTWWMAAETGTTVGWFALDNNWVVQPFRYAARHT